MGYQILGDSYVLQIKNDTNWGATVKPPHTQ